MRSESLVRRRVACKYTPQPRSRKKPTDRITIIRRLLSILAHLTGLLEDLGRQPDARRIEAVDEPGHHAGGLHRPQDFPAFADAFLLEAKQILQHDDVAFHPLNLAHTDD